MNRISILGILAFATLYIFSSPLYPGGSQADINSIGFDWVNNYWCNLMNHKSMNGTLNPARPYAITALVILCLSLALFFYQFANTLSQAPWKNIIKITGGLSMLCAVCMFTEFHDLMTILSSAFGLFVVIGIIIGVYRSNHHIYKIIGVFGLILLALNNYIYYTEHGIEHLPLLQKITFIIILSWIIGLNHEIRKRILNPDGS